MMSGAIPMICYAKLIGLKTWREKLMCLLMTIISLLGMVGGFFSVIFPAWSSQLDYPKYYWLSRLHITKLWVESRSKFIKNTALVLFAEQIPEKASHAHGATECVERIRISQRAYFWEDFLCDMTLKAFPLLGRVAQNVVQFDSGLKTFQFLPHDNIFFSFVGEEQSKVYRFLAWHAGNLPKDLIQRSDAASACNPHNPFDLLRESPWISTAILMMACPPGR